MKPERSMTMNDIVEASNSIPIENEYRGSKGSILVWEGLFYLRGTISHILAQRTHIQPWRDEQKINRVEIIKEQSAFIS